MVTAMYMPNLVPGIAIVSHKNYEILESNQSTMLPSLVTISVNIENMALFGPFRPTLLMTLDLEMFVLVRQQNGARPFVFISYILVFHCDASYQEVTW
uniref:Uncharacterized protein n=1 Tax=Rhipicephalus zambeziensis TaxID=60191 RepID=A0A224YG27_9ACAR